jgi:colanic acid/amylovoran biosynthesis glycosyltransferase
VEGKLFLPASVKLSAHLVTEMRLPVGGYDVTLGFDSPPVPDVQPRALPMKLAYLLSEYPTLGHTYLLREIRQLRALGWDIQTISIRRPGNKASSLSPAEAEELNSTWYIVGSGPFTYFAAHAATFVTRPFRYLGGLATAWRFGGLTPRRAFLATAYFVEAVCAGYRLKKAGITHLHSVYSTTVALILSRVFDVNLSMTLHGPAEFIDPEGFAIGEKVRAAELVCSISYFGRSQIMLWSSSSDWHKFEVTPLGVDLSTWEAAPFRETPSPFELISVGRLVEIKGYPLLLEAVARLQREGRNVRLTLVGDGQDRGTLEEQTRRLGIANQVVFAGWKTQGELRELYLASDVGVMSSFAEGVPVVLMEAMATGVPCVAPRINGIPELIRDGIDGLLFTASDVSELVSAIGKLMDNPGLRGRMASSSREQVADKYDLRKNVGHLSDVFSHWLSPESDPSAGLPEGQSHRFVAS